MYLRRLEIDHLKLIEKCALDLVETRTDAPRMWTVLIGRNGRCKTSILRSIAALSAGFVHATNLGKPWILSLADRRPPAPDAPFRRIPQMRAYFSIEAEATKSAQLPPGTVGVFSILANLPGEADFVGWSKGHGRHPNHPLPSQLDGDRPLDARDPYIGVLESGRQAPPDHALVHARRKQASHLFVAAYGNTRRLHRPGSIETRSGHEHRLASLFDPDYRITGLDHFKDLGNGRAERFKDLLQQALFRGTDLMHEISSVDLAELSFDDSGTPDEIQQDQTYTATLDLPGGPIEVPTAWLADGQQALLSWLADLIGHLMRDQREVTDPADFTGLVLVDDIDLHIHPDWQTRLVPALKRAFPKLQFIVTTHSPLIIASLHPQEVIELDLDESGSVVAHPLDVDPRLMTSTELYRRIFGVHETPPDPIFTVVKHYEFLCFAPHRTDEQEAERKRLRRKLVAAGIKRIAKPVPREPLPPMP